MSTKSGPLIGVDLAREERLKKCDQIIEQFEICYNSSHLAKLTKKNDQEVVKF